MLLTAGWFWLALLFPLFVGISLWKKQSETGSSFDYGQNYAESSEKLTRSNGNDVIDLYDVNFRPEGNSLSIKKSAGNTKIIVPEDVAIALEITVHNGIVKIFDKETEINPKNFRYFSEMKEESQKRIRINIQVDTGNIEVVKG
ncbi:cell wall-active antibiotics response protein LiaF [Lactococcus muris]|uniref:Cell wall-active antibiotics response protein LiaF n=2 Tax=Streptococcaceae TaxID=1300 RepID=A0ABV4D787_9LACT|nr:cell wall-active antibiotics response protein LiaF [Lactococcus sp. UBA7065]